MTASAPQPSQPQLTEVDYDPFASRELARAVPTTEAQRELWLADQLGREASLAYNESVSLVIEGPLDIAAMQDALLALADRHEALRATISADGASLLIVPRGALQASLVDLSVPPALPAAERDAAVLAARSRDVSEPFDLVEGPLVRATLMKTGEARHELLITAHHIVCDGWSFGVVAGELMALYARITGRQGLETMPPADSFGDYAVAQQGPEWQASATADTGWWVRQFEGDVPVLELPVDRPRRGARTFDSRRATLELDAALVDGVRRLGSRHGSSLFVTLFSAFAALLARLSGQDDIVVGVPSAGQASGGQRSLVGHCVQVLPVRVSVDVEAPFAELLSSARAGVLDAYEHQACTIGQLLKKLQLPRDPSRLPLASVLFNLDQAIRSEDLSVAGLKVELLSNPRRFEIFDLFVNASQVDGRIVLECQYNTALYDGSTVERWLALYREALARLVADASAGAMRSADALAPTPPELAAVARWNATALAHERGVGVDQLIARQAAATPEHIAVIAGDRRLSYRQIDQRANALAHALHERGVRPGDLVGLACGRNEHMVVGLVGILKAGAGYVPMDPAFPAERLAYMRCHSAAAVIVSDGSVVADVGALARSADGAEGAGGAEAAKGTAPLLVDQLGKRTDPPARSVGADDVAYVIYTSGSTGQPKGVRVPHRTVVNVLASMAREPGMSAAQTVLSVTTLSFDIAVAELLLPLSVGATIVVAGRDEAMDGERLRALIEGEGVDFVQATPSTWRLLLAAGWTGGPQMKALCGGEPLPPDLAAELLPRVGELWNCYGPTETTVWSSFHRVLRGDEAVPIGRPAANTGIHVVDAKLRPLPVGVAGEIFIGGEGVTLGYHGRPDLSAERFLPDPHRPGHAWYRTGDLGRWRADGVLECLGRSDHQVKVRGYRIELGEIEANLARHPDIDRCLVVTREDEPGDVRLVAYAVSRAPALDAKALREFLHRSLPEYMVPAHFVQLPALPLLPNGKIDRKALPRPDAETRPTTEARALHRSPVEAQVLRAMEEVLHLPGLSIHDDLFALGGHSLLAARLTARLNKEFGITLALRTVFEAPTAARLAAAVARQQEAGAPRRPRIEHIARAEAPLTVMQERIRFMEQMQPGRVVYNTPSAHRLRGAFDPEAFEASFRHIVQRHSSLRTVIETGAGGPVQRVLDHVAFDLPCIDLSELPAAEREAELMRRLEGIIDQPIAIDRAPLFRVALYRLAAEEHVFLFMPHHIIWDGWSFDLLYQEMAALLMAAHEGREHSLAPLPPLPITYADYAAWHAQWMQGEECAAQLAHWKRRFATIEPPRALPTDRPRSAGMTGTGAVEWVHIDTALTERLRQVAVEHGVTLNMLIMAVYAAMLGQATGSGSLVLGVPVRGRLASDVESVMGFFNNLLPVPLAVRPQMPLAAWLGEVKREMLDAFAHQDVPFERLASEREIAAHAGKAGLYQSLFSFQDARERQRRWGPLAHSSVLVMQKGATEDFGLWLMEVPSGLEGGINYNADLFDRTTAQRFRERLVGLLRLVATSPALSIASMLAAATEGSGAFADWVRARHATHDALRPASRPAAAAALTDRQRAMASIWAKVLGLDPQDITAEDNFLDLGGSSLLAMEAIAACERELGVRIEPRRFVFEALHQLAASEAKAPATPPAATAEAAATASSKAPDGRLSRWIGKLGMGSKP